MDTCTAHERLRDPPLLHIDASIRLPAARWTINRVVQEQPLPRVREAPRRGARDESVPRATGEALRTSNRPLCAEIDSEHTVPTRIPNQRSDALKLWY